MIHKFMLICLGYAGCCFAGSVTTLFTPGDVAPRVGFPASRPGQIAVTRYADQPALQCTWDAATAAWFEFGFHSRCPIPNFHRGKFHLNVWAPEDCKAEAISMRIVDRDGEVTQYRMPLDPARSGWQTLSFNLDTSEPLKSSWGKKDTLNKRLDLPILFAGIAISFRDKKARGELGMGQVGVENVVAVPTLDLITGTPIHILRPGDEDKLALEIRNEGTNPLPVTGSCTVTDAWKKILHRQEVKTDLPAAGSTSLPLPHPPRLGVFYVDLTINDGFQAIVKRLSYSYMEPAGPTPGRAKGFLFGVLSHSARFPRAEQELEATAMGLCGAKVRRCSSTWSRIQPTADAPRDYSGFEDLLALYEQNGIDSQVCFLNSPMWARDPNWKPFNPDYHNRFGRPGVPMVDLTAYGDFVYDFMSRYRDRIRYVESWNEPDLLSFANFSVENYIAMMKVFYTSVKKAAPDAQVLTGGYTCLKVSYPDRSSHPDHMAKSMAEAKGYYDIHAFHGHGSHAHYMPQIIGLHELHRKLGLEIPWWANETAISSINIGELAQAETLFRKLLFSWAQGAMAYTWYDLRNDGYDPEENEHNFGLITKDFYPKQAYAAYNALATVYHEAQYLREYAVPSGLQAYLFQAANGDYLLPSWNIGFRPASQLLTVTDINGTVSSVDLFGNESPVVVDQGVAFFEAGNAPFTLRFTNQQGEPRLVRDTVVAPREITVHPRRPGTFAVSLTNPTARPLRAVLNVAAPSDLTISPSELPLELAPNATREVACTIPANGTFRSPPGREQTAMITLRLGEHLQQHFAMTVRSIAVLSRELDGAPDFVLDQASQLHSTVLNEPGTSHLFWKGPEDLSGEIRFACSDDALTVQVLARDDRHVQPFRGKDVWKGDNVQLAMALPGQGGRWELGFTHHQDNDNEVSAWYGPEGFSLSNVIQALSLETHRDDNAHTTRYLATIPFAAVGLTPAICREGFAVNLLINDNDEQVREGFLVIAPGLGSGRKESAHYPIVCFE